MRKEYNFSKSERGKFFGAESQRKADFEDLRYAEQRMRDIKNGTEKTISLEKLLKDYNLKD